MSRSSELACKPPPQVAVLSNTSNSAMSIPLAQTTGESSLTSKALSNAIPSGRLTRSFQRWEEDKIQGVKYHQRSHVFELTCLRQQQQSHISDITTLDIGKEFISLDVFLRVMSITSNSLTKASFYVVYDIPPTSDLRLQNLAKINMPRLISLHMRLVNTYIHSGYFPPITFDVLRDMCIEWSDSSHPYQWDLRTHVNLLSSASATLQQLILADLPFYAAPGPTLHQPLLRPRVSSNDLHTLLSTLPNLQRLGLPVSVRVPEPILTSIASGSLLPDLKDIGLATAKDPQSILSMIQFRNGLSLRRVSPISALRLTLPKTPTTSVTIEARVEDLGLRKGYHLLLLQACKVCEGQCHFEGVEELPEGFGGSSKGLDFLKALNRAF
ncbi:hypothetical protein CVT26_007664 [Gymnopilus dilepis]|uniref:Uncharacterized protein n=1 Tax=Gymnopilus dilepis TaxID=231916 RepID=A0A409W818_9AGAR|nr:hypothetical protein CVT26_007664 [Gymnopilus dilepis]